MRKTNAIILTGIFVFAIIFINLNNNVDTEFNPCIEQPLFGLKYQNCDTIECANFYENIKVIVHNKYCEVGN